MTPILAITTPPFMGRVRPLYKTGWYYQLVPNAGTSAGTLTDGRCQFNMIVLDKPLTFDRIGVNCTTSSGGSAIRLGVYAEGSDGLPGSLITEFGTVDTSATTGFKEISLSATTLAPGVYFWAVAPQGGTPAITKLSFLGFYLGASVGATTPLTYYQDSVSGALPATASITSTAAIGSECVWVRVA